MPRFGLQKEFEELAVKLVDDRMSVRPTRAPKRRKELTGFVCSGVMEELYKIS
jgi:hypothetical protein